ncbi:MAG: terminase large subunit domain-containing protein, partial [Pirellulaceae bacterium]
MTINIRSLQARPSLFRDQVLLQTDSVQVQFGKVEEDWQYVDFAALDAGWMKCVGMPVEEPVLSRAWLERPRGHSKTTDIALSACWALFASKRPLRGVCAAVDKDQARLLLDAVARLLRDNPWLSKILELTAHKVVNKFTKASLEVISADTASSWGLLLDFVVMDECCHWSKRDLFDSLMSSAAKRDSCMVLCISNAGFLDSWAWDVREVVRTDPDWHFSRLDGPQASWISEAKLAEQRRLLPSTAYARLWLNEWSNNRVLSAGVQNLFEGRGGGGDEGARGGRHRARRLG